MKTRQYVRPFIVSVLALCIALIAYANAALPAQDEKVVLFEALGKVDQDRLETRDASTTRVADGRLCVHTGRDDRWPGITIEAPEGGWDLSSCPYVGVDIENAVDEEFRVDCRIDDADGKTKNGYITLAAGIRDVLPVYLRQPATRLTKPLELIGMRGNPKAADEFDASKVTRIVLFVNRPEKQYAWTVGKAWAGGEVVTVESDKFIPFIDRFGQYIHRDWPGKTHSEEDLAKHRSAETVDLEKHPGPDGWNQYGGWAAGPQLEASGFFRTTKYNDRWWLVDPEGRLFWSHGIDCVRTSNDTPISDRENYFQWLPAKDSAFGAFYGRGSWAPRGYYHDHSPYETFDFTKANLLRKYGDDWFDAFADVTHQRLRSWGMNTIANWSDSDIYEMRRTPYVTTIHTQSPVIEGSEGYWRKFFDVFDPGFRASIREAMEAQKGRSVGDPWCIGVFVHNELSWGNDVSLSLAVLKSPADQPAKKAFVDELRKKYDTIDKLNEAWGTDHASWGALLKSTEPPSEDRARDDLERFYTEIAERYFRIIREEIKRVAPNLLYMGCRFAWVNDRAALAAAKYCDVIGYNRYRYSVAEFRPPEGVDKPVIIGEFHVGALDRGMFHTGLRQAINQADRARKYRHYVLGALNNPYIVGTHWFQYKDQATTGRGDGENYQIGFVDACDTPYPETIAASRDVGYRMYVIRGK